MIPLLIRFHRPLIGLALILALMWALNTYVADAIHDDRLEATVEAQQRDAVADDRAGQVAASEAATIEQENDAMRKASMGSGDPLKAGLDRLRQRQTGGR